MLKRRVHRHEVVQPRDLSYRLIPLTQGQNALVDAVDFEWLRQWNWLAFWSSDCHKFYARRVELQKPLFMHRIILGLNEKQQVDHWNRNTLDNRRENLRICTPLQNAYNHGKQKNNTSGFKGVSWNNQYSHWRARIHVSGKMIFLGSFDSAIEAAIAYDEAATKYHGEFAVLNLPNEN
jgi:hypothetical protein